MADVRAQQASRAPPHVCSLHRTRACARWPTRTGPRRWHGRARLRATRSPTGHGASRARARARAKPPALTAARPRGAQGFFEGLVQLLDLGCVAGRPWLPHGLANLYTAAARRPATSTAPPTCTRCAAPTLAPPPTAYPQLLDKICELHRAANKPVTRRGAAQPPQLVTSRAFSAVCATLTTCGWMRIFPPRCTERRPHSRPSCCQVRSAPPGPQPTADATQCNGVSNPTRRSAG
jgi:hypothetical protein